MTTLGRITRVEERTETKSCAGKISGHEDTLQLVWQRLEEEEEEESQIHRWESEVIPGGQ